MEPLTIGLVLSNIFIGATTAIFYFKSKNKNEGLTIRSDGKVSIQEPPSKIPFNPLAQPKSKDNLPSSISMKGITGVRVMGSIKVKIEKDSIATYGNTSITLKGHTMWLEFDGNNSEKPQISTFYDFDDRQLERVSLVGSGSIELINQSPLDIILQGSGYINIEKAKSKVLDLSLEGSGKIIVQKSELKMVNSNIQGSGKIDIRSPLETHSSKIEGSGKIKTLNFNNAFFKNSVETHTW